MRGRGLLAGVLLVLLLAVAAAGGILYYLQSQKPAPDPFAVYRPAMNPGFTIVPERLQALPQYSITLRLDPATRAFTGTSEVSFVVTAGLPQDEILFRLYPNLPQFNGVMHVSSAQVNGASMSFAYDAANTAVRVPVPPLQTGTRATARLTFTGEAPKHRADYYTIFGQSEDILSLTNFYPILARYRSDGWATDVADPQGDVGFHDAALYRVTTIMPPGQVVVATGSVVTQTVLPDKQLRTEYVQGPAREFTLIMSPRFQVEEMDAYGTLVRSYYIPEQAMAGRSALYAAVASLQVYSDVFGPYPYREMAVVQAPLTFHGMEFPGINLIGTDAYSKHLQDLETLVAHEVAHQWWYNQVGSDQNRTPWLDEGLAEFSMYYYQGLRYGEDFAAPAAPPALDRPGAVQPRAWARRAHRAAGHGLQGQLRDGRLCQGRPLLRHPARRPRRCDLPPPVAHLPRALYVAGGHPRAIQSPGGRGHGPQP